MRALLVSLATLLLWTSLLDPRVAEARPPLLEAQPGCELWLGQAHGNDPSVRVNLRLCPGEGGALNGELQWSSTESGHNVRAVTGSRSGNRIQLRDERIVEERPEPGWRFCTIDRYELRLTNPDTMEGSYIARACDDHATLTLRKVGETAATGPGSQPAGAGSQPTGPGSQPTGAADRTAEQGTTRQESETPDGPREASDEGATGPRPEPPAAEADSGCNISPARGDDGATLAILFGVSALLAHGRRRRRATASRSSSDS